jgi:hypothetical protein
MHIKSLRFTSSEPATDEGMVGKETCDAVGRGGDWIWNIKMPPVGNEYLISCSILFLVRSK